MNRLFGLIALVGTLMLAQSAFAWHGADHLADFDGGYDEVCLECLALINASPAPPVAATLPVVMPVLRPSYDRVEPPRLARVHRTYFRSRAPPFFQS